MNSRVVVAGFIGLIIGIAVIYGLGYGGVLPVSKTSILTKTVVSTVTRTNTVVENGTVTLAKTIFYTTTYVWTTTKSIPYYITTTYIPTSTFTPYNRSISALVKGFLTNASKFYLKYNRNISVELVGGFCRALLLNGSVINDTFIRVSGRLYQYGVLAYLPPNSGYYWFPKQVRLKDVLIIHIPPLKNITVTGGFGPTNWFRISRGNVVKTVYFTSYAGVVYESCAICGSEPIPLGNESIVIVKAFIVRVKYGSSPIESSLWLALLPTNQQ